jgi:hypothetical protein
MLLSVSTNQFNTSIERPQAISKRTDDGIGITVGGIVPVKENDCYHLRQ